MKLLHSDENRIIAMRKDGTVITLTDVDLLLDIKRGKNRGKCLIDLDDAILLNRTLFKLNKPLYDERDRLIRKVEELTEGTIYNTFPDDKDYDFTSITESNEFYKLSDEEIKRINLAKKECQCCG